MLLYDQDRDILFFGGPLTKVLYKTSEVLALAHSDGLFEFIYYALLGE